jgi:peptidoglycan hydrolase CwlO-like protein
LVVGAIFAAYHHVSLNVTHRIVEMNDVPQVNLSKADVVRRFTVSRVTLDRYISTGKITAVKGERIGRSEPAKYEWSLDLSEVRRVFKERGGAKPKKASKADNDTEIQLLRQRVEMLEQQVRDKDEQVREAQKNKDDWKRQFEQSQSRLEDLRSQSFLKKLFG